METPMQELIKDLDIIIKGNLPFTLSGIKDMIEGVYLEKEKQAIIEAYEYGYQNRRTDESKNITGKQHYNERYKQ